MTTLLTRILGELGGMDRWKGYDRVEATIVSGGGFFALKSVLQDSGPRRMTVWLHEERSSIGPYGAPDQRTIFTPEVIGIEMSTLHRAYFKREALWTYLTTPFLV